MSAILTVKATRPADKGAMMRRHAAERAEMLARHRREKREMDKRMVRTWPER